MKYFQPKFDMIGLWVTSGIFVWKKVPDEEYCSTHHSLIIEDVQMDAS
jgi:hypothetical protein